MRQAGSANVQLEERWGWCVVAWAFTDIGWRPGDTMGPGGVEGSLEVELSDVRRMEHSAWDVRTKGNHSPSL